MRQTWRRCVACSPAPLIPGTAIFLQSTPQLVEALPLEEDHVKLSCGARHTVVLTGQPALPRKEDVLYQHIRWLTKLPRALGLCMRASCSASQQEPLLYNGMWRRSYRDRKIAALQSADWKRLSLLQGLGRSSAGGGTSMASWGMQPARVTSFQVK
jgi:hypothetical protein